jgi:probable rRNA maturation factor
MQQALEVIIETAVPETTEAALRDAVDVVMSRLQLAPAELSILLTDDEYIRSLNSQFREFDEATDVLSFPAGDETVDLGDGLQYLGDIAISVPYAERQALARGHSTVAELQLLAVHGMLHLLGYDHEHPEDKATMWAIQQDLLEQMGLQGVLPTEEEHE